MRINWNLLVEMQREEVGVLSWIRVWTEKLKAAITKSEKEQAEQELHDLRGYLSIVRSVPAYLEWKYRPWPVAAFVSPYHRSWGGTPYR